MSAVSFVSDRMQMPSYWPMMALRSSGLMPGLHVDLNAGLGLQDGDPFFGQFVRYENLHGQHSSFIARLAAE